MNPPTEPATPHEEPGALSWGGLSLAIGIPLAVFAFANPIWQQHDIRAWDQNILWSYLVIPVLVVVLLRLEGKLNWASFGLELMKVTFIKFVISYSVATVIWEFRGAPGTGLEEQVAGRDSGQAAFEVHEVPALANPWPAEELGRLDCLVMDEAGIPVVNALLYVGAGLEGYTFQPPSASLEINNDGSGFAPRFLVAQAHQVVSLRTHGTQLHTAVFSGAKHRLLNFPVIPNSSRDVMFDRAHGSLALSCSVHGRAEPQAEVLVLGHPFWAFTDENGRVDLPDLPPLELDLVVRREGHPLARRSVTVLAGSSQMLSWKLAPQD